MAAKESSQNILARISTGIVTSLEKAFFIYGNTIAKRPWSFIIACCIFTGICSLGLLNFTTEERPFKLWIPHNSEFLEVMEWQKENFPVEYRLHIAIYEAENVLDKHVIKELLRVHEAVTNTSTNDATWRSVCATMPTIVNTYFSRRRRSATQDIVEGYNLESQGLQRSKRQKEEPDWSMALDRDEYCGFYDTIDQECMEHSILELWGYDEDYINELTPEEIVDDLYYESKSAVFGFPTNFTQFLGKVERNAEGKIIKAGAAMQMWITHINLTAIDVGDFVDDTGTGMEVDAVGFNWEKEFIKTILDDKERPDDIKVYLMASSSFGEISAATIMGDVKYLALGFGVMFVYVQIMLGKFDLIEQRPLLSFMGLGCVGMAIFVSYGICSVFGVPFGPVNNVLPFLLLGLGIDDMFVIMQAWNNLSPVEKQKKLVERIGNALKHAGVSITVTSVTDFAAFAIGSGTVLPALRSFCLYAAVGIIIVYIFQATFFVAWLALDQKRLEDKRQGCFWFWKLENWTPYQCSQQDYCQKFFTDIYGKYLFTWPAKVLVLILTIALTAVSGWGLSNLRQEFNPIWFLPQSTYLYKFFMKQQYYFPTSGEMGTIYFGQMNYFEQLNKIEQLILKMEESDTISEVDNWYTKYKEYWMKFEGEPLPKTEEEFHDKLSLFLHSASGSKYRVRNFRFNGTINCTDAAPPIISTSIEYKHTLLNGAKEQINAMDNLKNLVKDMNFDGEVYAWAKAYSGWETDKIIEKELYTNMGLAMMVVFIVTLTLIANLTMSLFVLLCVILTLIDVGALMHWWGLTIDTVSCIDIVLAIGLCVDYAAHIGHTFMKKQGTRDERARITIANIGPAVLNGGFSTFLAFVFLVNSDSHVFITFYKIFFAVVMYGVFHGLVFLPVLLSLIGPAPYPNSEKPEISETEAMCHNLQNQSDGKSGELESLNDAKSKELNGCIENNQDEFVSVRLDSGGDNEKDSTNL